MVFIIWGSDADTNKGWSAGPRPSVLWLEIFHKPDGSGQSLRKHSALEEGASEVTSARHPSAGMWLGSHPTPSVPLPCMLHPPYPVSQLMSAPQRRHRAPEALG